MALVQKAFSDIITFSRSSNATRVGPTGLVEYAPHNLLTYSADFSDATWTKTNSTVTANAIAAPDGTVTADALNGNGTSAQHYVSQASVWPSGSAHTFSIYAKKNTASYIHLLVSGVNAYLQVSLDDGSVVASSNGTATGVSNTITNVGNGYFRITLTATQSTGSPVSIRIYPLEAVNNTAGPIENTNKGIYVWGAQLAVGPYALDYTPTTSAAVYGPRFDYDPVTLAARGLLVEEQRTNLLTYSEDLSSADWVTSNSAKTSNAAISPDGTATADLVVPNTSNASHDVYQAVSLSAITYTYSIFVKPAGYTLYNIRVFGSGGIAVVYNLTNQTIDGSQGTNLGTSIQSVGNGWYRLTLTFTGSAGTNYMSIQPTAAGYTFSNGNTVFAGNGTSGAYVWGAQLEAGSFATSYIPTLASTVTRSADVASVNTLSPWFNATEGTLFADVDSALLPSDYTNGRAIALNDTSGDNVIETYLSQNAAVAVNAVGRVMVSGVEQAGVSKIITNSANPHKIAFAYKANDFAVTGDGLSSPATDTSGSLPTVTQMQLGALLTSNYLNGHLRRIAYYPRRLTNTELAALTA